MTVFIASNSMHDDSNYQPCNPNKRNKTNSIHFKRHSKNVERTRSPDSDAAEQTWENSTPQN